MWMDVQCMRAGTAAGAWWRQRPERHRCTDEALMQAIRTSMAITASKACTRQDDIQSIVAEPVSGLCGASALHTRFLYHNIESSITACMHT